MDPFSLSVGIAGLVGLVAKALEVSEAYVSKVKHAKESIIALITELEALQSNLSGLDALLRSDSARAHGLAFQRTSVLRSCALACDGNLKSLCKKLAQMGDSRTGRYVWPLSEKEHQKTVQELRTFTQWMQFALTVDGCSLLSQTSDEVLKIMGQQLESFESLASLGAQTVQLQEVVAHQTRLLNDDRNAETRHDILNWLSKIEHDKRHHSVRSYRVQGTGSWLLERSEYMQWRDDGPNVLWCHGIQGSGKSVLISFVIDELKRSISSPESPIVFFYFDYWDKDNQTPTRLLSSILRQIVATIPDTPKCVTDAYSKTQGVSECLQVQELENMISEITSTIHRVYIIIDGLDECDESRHRKVVLQFLYRMTQIPNIRLLVTSRQYTYDIEVAFHTHSQIVIQAHESDLRRYMHHQLDCTNISDIVDDNFKSMVVETLIDRAQGMFLLPILQLRSVLNEPTAGEMEDALVNLSRSLPEAFEETVARIQQLPESWRRLAINTLMWICHTKRPLTIPELIEVLSVRLGQTNISPKHYPSPRMIVECCQGLVTLDSENMSIRFAHYAIQEYLIVRSEELFPCVESNMAAICLTYLLSSAFKEGPCLEESEIHSRIDKNPFVSYACRYWGMHVQSCEADRKVQQLAFDFFASHSAVARAYQIMEFEKGRLETYWTPEECFSVTALHHASYFGLENIIGSLLDQRTYHIDSQTKMGTTPLIKAACASPAGHPSIVKMLLQRGANPYFGNWYGNALLCAAEAGCSTIIRQLVDYGMNPNESENCCRLPIHCTLDNDCSGAFETLVELGADISFKGASVFHEAILNGCVNIVDVVLQRHWVELEYRSTEKGLTAIHFAAIAENMAIISKLLEAGADINARDNEGCTALDYMDNDLNKDIVSFLLDHGAE